MMWTQLVLEMDAHSQDSLQLDSLVTRWSLLLEQLTGRFKNNTSTQSTYNVSTRWVVLEDDEQYKMFAEDIEAFQCVCRH